MLSRHQCVLEMMSFDVDINNSAMGLDTLLCCGDLHMWLEVSKASLSLSDCRMHIDSETTQFWKVCEKAYFQIESKPSILYIQLIITK